MSRLPDMSSGHRGTQWKGNSAEVIIILYLLLLGMWLRAI
jgi:hypothetical protein